MSSPPKTVLITGCSAGGIGEAFVREFHEQGLRVFATACTLEEMDSFSTLPRVQKLVLDVTDLESIRAAKAVIVEETGGKLDILVNNAGIAYPYPVTDCSMDEVRKLFDVNLFGPVMMTQEFVPLLLSSNHARIVQMSSITSIAAIPFGFAYSASKAALTSFSDTLRVELAPFGIKVITCVLGNIQSNITKPWIVLPDTSMYEPIKDIYKRERVTNYQKAAVPREPVVKNIVAETLKQKPPIRVWGGANVWAVWFSKTFLGTRVLDWILASKFGLIKLAGILAQQKKFKA